MFRHLLSKKNGVFWFIPLACLLGYFFGQQSSIPNVDSRLAVKEPRHRPTATPLRSHQCDDKNFLNTPPIPKGAGNLSKAQEMTAFYALTPVRPEEMPETRGWDNEAFDAFNEFFWGMERGIILELGGLDGQRYSVSRDFLPMHWHRILMEASPRYTQVAVERSPDATYIAAAVCNQEHVHYLISSNKSSGAINGIAEFMTYDLLKAFHKEAFRASRSGTDWSSVNSSEWSPDNGASVTTIPCATLKNVFECLDILHINFFVLDVEGGEISVLESIDFTRVTFDVLCVETDPVYRLPGYRLAVTNFLQKHGYVKVFDRTRNTWFRRKDFQPTSKTQAQSTVPAAPSSTLNSLLEVKIFSSPCNTNVPRFLSFAWSHVGRWSKNDILMAAKLMYSSLARAHRCAPIVYMYTNDHDVAAGLSSMNTTMQTKSNFRAIVRDISSIKSRGYDTWRDMSAYKLDVISEHLDKGEQLIWLDLDTLVFTDLSPTLRNGVAWVVAWAHGKRGRGSKEEQMKAFSGTLVPPKFEALGDLWSLNSKAVAEVLALEKEYTEKNIAKPEYDLQGYFSILLYSGSPYFKIIQDIMPDYSFGFQCSDHHHPTREQFRPQVIQGELHCPDKEDIGLASKVGSISFTATTFMDTILSDPLMFTGVSDPASREWLRNWFYP